MRRGELPNGQPAGSGQIFILCSDERVTCREFFGYHWRWAGRRGNPPTLPLTAATLVTRGLWRLNSALGRSNEATPDTMYMLARSGGFSNAKARRLLGFSPKVGLAEGMRRSESWLRGVGELQD